MAIQVPTELIEAARNGGPTQIEALLEIVWPEAYRLARAIVNDRVEAEDAAQEACITMYRTIAELRNAAAFRVWFYRIVVREAAARKRKQARQVKAVVAIPDPVDETALIDVWNALATLPDSLRSVVVLRYFEDLSSREIASVLRIPDGTVRALMLSYDLPGAGRRSNHLLTVVLANPAAYTAKPNDTRSKPVPHSAM